MTKPEATAFHQRIAKRTGLAPDLVDRPALDGFIERRCGELGLPGAAAYQELVFHDADEMDRLVQEVAVAETWFFRYPASFDLLSDHAARLWRESHESLRMLSIACATGEEPYSMAMAAAQAGWPLDRIVVDAVDRHEQSLAIARTACYGKRSFRESLPAWAEKWFHRGALQTQVDSRLAATVRFHCQDALTAVIPGDDATYDAVFCRNLFIYLHGAARTKLVDFLCSVLAADGLLFVGHAEYAVLPHESFASAGVSHAFALRLRRSSDHDHHDPPVRSRSMAPSASPPTFRAAARPPAQPRGIAPRREPTLDEARALANAGQMDAAIAVLQDMRSSSPGVYDLLGSIQLSLGRFEQAREAFQKVLYFEPHHETALLHMAIICERLGKAEQAARYRRRAARAHAQNAPPQP